MLATLIAGQAQARYGTWDGSSAAVSGEEFLDRNVSRGAVWCYWPSAFPS